MCFESNLFKVFSITDRCQKSVGMPGTISGSYRSLGDPNDVYRATTTTEAQTSGLFETFKKVFSFTSFTASDESRLLASAKSPVAFSSRYSTILVDRFSICILFTLYCRLSKHRQQDYNILYLHVAYMRSLRRLRIWVLILLIQAKTA